MHQWEGAMYCWGGGGVVMPQECDAPMVGELTGIM